MTITISRRKLKALLRDSYLSGANDVPLNKFLFWVHNKIVKLEAEK